MNMKPKSLEAELFYRPDDMLDNSDISENVLNIFEVAGRHNEISVSDEQVDGSIQEVNAESEEDMLVYGCYIGECLALRKEVDLQKYPLSYLRNKVLDSLIALTELYDVRSSFLSNSELMF